MYGRLLAVGSYCPWTERRAGTFTLVPLVEDGDGPDNDEDAWGNR
jgi:hypothetical protein